MLILLISLYSSRFLLFTTRMTEKEIDIYYKTILDLVSLAGKVSLSTLIKRGQ